MTIEETNTLKRLLPTTLSGLLKEKHTPKGKGMFSLNLKNRTLPSSPVLKVVSPVWRLVVKVYPNGWAARRIMRLLEFDFQIDHKPG